MKQLTDAGLDLQNYPALTRALAAHSMAFEAMHSGNRLGPRAAYSRESMEWADKQAAWEEAEAAVNAAYRSELLPRLLGDEWVVAKPPPLKRSNGGIPFYGIASSSLFDHPQHLRRKGSRGALTWESLVLLGQPYGANDAERQVEAVRFAAENNVSIWSSESLSGWNPGSTVLVIAARDLPRGTLAAASFGFSVMAEPPARG